MDAAGIFKKALGDLALREANMITGQPRSTSIQSVLTDEQVAFVLSLPVKRVAPIVDEDPALPTYGRRAFVLGISDFASDDVLGGF